MRLTINLRHIEQNNQRLEGELSSEFLDLDIRDELVQAHNPLKYNLCAELHGANILVTGFLELVLDCECIRCLRSFQHSVTIPNWTCDLPLEGEDRVVIENDCVDLTPYLRDDILLEFPQHPLCDRQCRGLPNTLHRKKGPRGENSPLMESSAWTELDKLKL